MVEKQLSSDIFVLYRIVIILKIKLILDVIVEYIFKKFNNLIFKLKKHTKIRLKTPS